VHFLDLPRFVDSIAKEGCGLSIFSPNQPPSSKKPAQKNNFALLHMVLMMRASGELMTVVKKMAIRKSFPLSFVA